jgi:succinate dehydrogenase / fumarate reductase cytochrome b subunit
MFAARRRAVDSHAAAGTNLTHHHLPRESRRETLDRHRQSRLAVPARARAGRHSKIEDMATPSSEAPRRPLSPHLGVYRWQWTMALSILHRITGIGLAIGTLLLIYWLWAAASGPDAYAAARAFLTGWFGVLLLIGWSAAFYYHLFNGIRHLFWDAGKGFELRTGWLSGMAVVTGTVAATAVTWIVVATTR